MPEAAEADPDPRRKLPKAALPAALIAILESKNWPLRLAGTDRGSNYVVSRKVLAESPESQFSK